MLNSFLEFRSHLGKEQKKDKQKGTKKVNYFVLTLGMARSSFTRLYPIISLIAPVWRKSLREENGSKTKGRENMKKIGRNKKVTLIL